MCLSYAKAIRNWIERNTGVPLKPNRGELAALSRLFSSAVFHELAKKGRSPLFKRLLSQTRVPDECTPNRSVGQAFDSAFSILKIAGHRDEYVYRTALTKNILLGKHSLRTASMLNEFRIGARKADLVILNGTATVYEIKSERDSLTRLAEQIEAYRRVFATVNVIVGENHIDGVRSVLPSDIGIMQLTRRNHISVEREAIDSPERICPSTVLGSLRSAEAVEVLKALNVYMPEVPNTQRHAVLREKFSHLSPTALHREMVKVLKKSRNLAPLTELVQQVPVSLQAAALSVPVKRSDHAKLLSALTTPIHEAMNW